MLTSAVAILILGQAASPAPKTTVLTAQQIAEALDKAPAGQPGLQVATLLAPHAYGVLEVRRTAAGGSELHAEMADVWYVLRGKGTVVTGGSLVDGVTTEPGEMRGKGIAGGDTRELSAGDLVVVPPGVPHWLSQVQGGEFVYLVVKARGERATP
jgi:mannose-6-phosphate isomerase-like protein (cupin superfamily)